MRAHGNLGRMPSQIDELSRVITEAIARAITSGEIEASLPEAIPLERPKNRDHGDYATSIALQLAKAAGKNPREVALILQKHIGTTPLISAVDIAGPGFLNFTLNRASQANLVNSIIESGAKYGQGNSLSGVRINLEFISANPTGPLHLGHTRWAAVGDALGRVLSAAGADISREFYINDRGNQMDLFGASLEAAALGKPHRTRYYLRKQSSLRVHGDSTSDGSQRFHKCVRSSCSCFCHL